MSGEKQLKLLALPFSTEDVLRFKELEEEIDSEINICIPDWLSTGLLTEELARPMVKTFEGEGVMIIDHKKKTASEIISAIRVLEKFDKKLYSLSRGLRPLTAATMTEKES